MAEEKSGFVGPNDWFVDEMEERWRADPSSVSQTWGDYFEGDGAAATAADFEPSAPPEAPADGAPVKAPKAASPVAVDPARVGNGAAAAPARAQPGPARPSGSTTRPTPASAVPALPAATAVPLPVAAPTAAAGEDRLVPLRGASAAVARNMEASLGVPTATSIRPMPARLLEQNRKVINNYLGRHRSGKISFTHLIGYAVVQAVKALPAMNNEFVPATDGQPAAVRHRRHIGLGLAVDQHKPDGSRVLVVVVVKDADTMDFQGFWQAYDTLVRKVTLNKLALDDLQGATISLTNPGTIGTEHSVPRLMPGQGCIVGVGRIDWPASFRASDPRALAELGMSKEVVLTSTYDHRIIQGAESGEFLAKVDALLLGGDGFYDEIFAALGVPYVPIRWSKDVNPADVRGLRARLEKQVHVQTLIRTYRVRGHLIADLDPLRSEPPAMPVELDPATYGLTVWDLDREFLANDLAGHDLLTLEQILGVLRDAYCRTVGVEYMHIQEREQQHWIQAHVEGVDTKASPEEQRHILGRLNAAEALEKFLETKYIGAKRFGIEGAESAIPTLDAVLDAAAVAGLPEAVIGMAHRGRLNVLVNIVGQSYHKLFDQFEGNLDPDTAQGSGDVKYHKGFRGTFTGLSSLPIDVTLSSNPSHLEAVDPVVEGMARARQDILDRGAEYPVLPILVHGDAAFAGQGAVAETLNMSQLRGYTTGGTLHLVINNQVGFTTNPDSARSSTYATDVARMVQAPIFHVNGDDPEACTRVARLALDFRTEFHKDVVIEMVCYRKLGHNETDDPSLTQPLMYKRIQARRSVRKVYVEQLVRRGDMAIDEAEAALADFSTRLQRALEETRAAAPPRLTVLPPPAPAPLEPPAATAVSEDRLQQVAEALFTQPPAFTLHPKLHKVFDARAKLWAGGEVDWAMGEALALGTMLLDGHDVRMSGQDTRRGTFGHRNAVLVDYETGGEYAPLAHVAAGQGRFFIYDSLLSEYAAVGFEYGYALTRPEAFVAWEAQFGDFVNGAQIIIDQFVVAAEPKWGQTCGLTLLLPHGYEGQGPEHSSGRIERFLTLCAEGNIQVANVTTASQLFHLLRRQVVRELRKPLVLFTPKAYLRSKEAHSPVADLTGGTFQEVVDDPEVVDPASVRRVVLASGKVALDAMVERRRRGDADHVAIVRVEQLYPFPRDPIVAAVARYEQAEEVCWLQEEPDNMGPWAFVESRLRRLLGSDYRLTHVGRHESGSPAAGSKELSDLEKAHILALALA